MSKQFKTKKRNILPLLITIIIVMSIIAIALFGGYYYLNFKKDENLERIKELEEQLERSKSGVSSDLTFVNFDLLDFAKDEEEMMNSIKDFIYNDLEKKDITTVVILDNVEKETSTLYKFYFQIDSEYNDVVKAIYSNKTGDIEFVSGVELENIEEIGGVSRNSDKNVRDLYVNNEPKEVTIKYYEQEKLLEENYHNLVNSYMLEYININEYDKNKIYDSVNYVSEEDTDDYVVLHFTITNKDEKINDYLDLYFNKNSMQIFVKKNVENTKKD